MANLFRRKSAQSSICPIYHANDETIEHFLLQCPWMKAIWFGGTLSYTVDKDGISSWKQSFKAINISDRWAAQDREWFLSHVVFTCWHIWKARCNFLFNQCAINSPQIFFPISNAVTMFLEANRIDEVQPTMASIDGGEETRWSPPTSPFIKINVDTSWAASIGSGFVGIVARNGEDKFLATRRQAIVAKCAGQAEAMALLHGCELSISQGFNRVIMESDLLKSISCFNDLKENGSWRVYPILAIVEKLRESF